MSHKFTEDIVEQATLDWLEDLGYSIAHGPDIAFDGSNPERASYSEVLLPDRLKAAVARFNPSLPLEAIAEALRKVQQPSSPALIVNNRSFHKMLADGVEVEVRRDDV